MRIIYVEFKNKNEILLAEVFSKKLFFELNISEYYKKIKNFLELDIYSKYNLFNKVPILFSGKAAATVSHEILGHILEIDNFYYYNYKEYINLIENLNLTISDNPYLIPELGLTKKDDLICPTQVTNLFVDGKFTNELIGGSSKNFLCSRNFRRASFAKRILPRMSTLSISQKNFNSYKLDKYINVTDIQYAKLNHKNRSVEFIISGASYVENDCFLFRLSDNKLEFKISYFLKHLTPMYSNSHQIHILQCLKKGQVIHSGVETVNWLFNL